MTDELRFRSWKKGQKGKMSVIRKSFLVVRMNYRTTLAKKIKEDQHHSSHVKPNSSSTQCPGQMDEPNCLLLSTNILEAANCLKVVKPTLAHDVTFKLTPRYSLPPSSYLS